jgi:serine/threonine protein kinase
VRPPSDGQEFGKYELLERIAAGGMAEIYRARMRAAAGVTKPVAIKKILPHYAGNRAFVSMFINEAQIAVGLSHGNIVQVFDFGEVDGEYFLAMEWVHGQPLSRVLRRAREKGLAVLPPPLALLVAIEMLKGLAYAHTRLDEAGRPLNIVHRDISPQNVLVSYEGQVKLTDFGIARARLAGGPEAQHGAPQGKYAYFAPEQARGDEPDTRADIFAAGTVLYELLCGRLPCEGKVADVLRRIALGDFPRPRALNPELPPALERIVLTAMAPDPEQRYPTAQDFGEALATYHYTAAPDFSSSALAHFMGYLFEPELVAEGRPVQLPRDFLSQLARWGQGLAGSTPPPLREPPRRDSGSTPVPLPGRPSGGAPASGERITQRLPAVPTGSPPPPTPPGSLERITQPVPSIPVERITQPVPSIPVERITLPVPPLPIERVTQPVPGLPPPTPAPEAGPLEKTVPVGPRRLRLRRLLLTLTPAVVATLVGIALVTVESAGNFSVELTSSPPGARVRVDGKPWYAGTPTLVTQLDAEHEHLLEVLAEGMQPWSQRVRAERGSTLALHARLRPERQPVSAARVHPPVQHEGRFPLSGFPLSAAHHALRVPPSPAARVGLDPRKSYAVSTAGGSPSALTFTPRPSTEVVYLLEGDARLPARESFGILGPQQQKLSHASALYLFVLGAPGEAAGSIEVHVREEQSGAVTTVRVDERRNTVTLPPEARFTLRGLDPATTYELLVREAEPPAHTRGPRGGRVGRVLCLRGRGEGPGRRGAQDETRGTPQVLEVGHPYRVTGTGWVHFTFPDDDPENNAGALTVDIAPISDAGPPPAPLPRGRG